MLIIAVLVLETLKLVLTILALLFELGGIAFNTQEMVELFPDEKPSRPSVTTVFTRRISLRTLKRDLRDDGGEALIQLELYLTVSLPLPRSARTCGALCGGQGRSFQLSASYCQCESPQLVMSVINWV